MIDSLGLRQHTMRVVMPYTDVHPLADEALRRIEPDAERVDVGQSTTAYWELMCRLWADGETFLLVEHDIEVNALAMYVHHVCREWWCVAPYIISGPKTADCSLGCTKFRSELLEAEPDLIDAIAGATPGVGLVRCDWRRLDAEISGGLRARGYEPHVHRRPVLHHHIYPGLGCACGSEH